MVIQNPDHYQPYFRAFCLAKNLKNGDKCKSYEYMAWIDGKHRTFRIMRGYPDTYLPLWEEHVKPFEDWLFSEAKKESAPCD